MNASLWLLACISCLVAGCAQPDEQDSESTTWPGFVVLGEPGPGLDRISIHVLGVNLTSGIVLEANQTTYLEMPLLEELFELGSRLNASTKPFEIGAGYFPTEEVREVCEFEIQVSWSGEKWQRVYWLHGDRTYYLMPYVSPCMT